MRFSQRIGKTGIRDTLQIESLDDELRTALWNELYAHILEPQMYRDPRFVSIARDLLAYLHRPIDEASEFEEELHSFVRAKFMQGLWYEVYDLVEFFAACDSAFSRGNHVPVVMKRRYVEGTNAALERELAGYRLVDGRVVPITSEEEVSAIERAMENRELSNGARAHLRAALDYLSDRNEPDYRNSVKESISAVESLGKQLTGDKSATLPTVLRKLDDRVIGHLAFRQALDKLYGWASDSGGIRHGALELSSVDQADAKLMLVLCSAFVNYLLAKAAD